MFLSVTLQGSQRVVPAPAVAASPACVFLEMQILRHHPKPIESEPLGVRPDLVFTNPPSDPGAQKWGVNSLRHLGEFKGIQLLSVQCVKNSSIYAAGDTEKVKSVY